MFVLLIDFLTFKQQITVKLFLKNMQKAQIKSFKVIKVLHF
jgi:hypothetical protein